MEDLLIEIDELSEKLDKLTIFLESDKVKTIDHIHVVLLTTQCSIMKMYLSILIERKNLLDLKKIARELRNIR